jgi:uncharacterized protein
MLKTFTHPHQGNRMTITRQNHESEGSTGVLRGFPVPMQALSNGEFDPPPQTGEQKQVQALLLDMSDREAGRQGMARREFLQTPCGMASAFLAMNMVYGNYFSVGPGETRDPEESRERARHLSRQFIFDDQLHYLHDDYRRKDLLFLRGYAKLRLNPSLRGQKTRFEKLRIENFFREVFLQSDTQVGLLSSATADKPGHWFLPNHQIASGRRRINTVLKSRRLLCHSLFAPGHPGWLDEIDKAVEQYKPDAWKGYPVGDPFHFSRFPYRLDDEKLVYPAYEKFVKAGIRNVCIHKGLLPLNLLKKVANFRYESVDDLPRAARDWPELNFIIYHAAFRPSLHIPGSYLRHFEETGHMEWVTDLAWIPHKYGLRNIYADIGSTFALTAVLHPRLAAAVLGILIQGLGEDHILWGTDSIFYGSPQWQIEAFRRLEIPPDMQKKHGFSPLGGSTSRVKEKILGLNGAKLYGLDPGDYQDQGELAALRDSLASTPDKGEALLSRLLRDELK